MNSARRVFVLVGLIGTLAFAPGCGRTDHAEQPPAAEQPSTAAPPTSSPSTPSDNAEWIVRGNEPFWAINVTRDAIVFLEPERQDGIRGAYAPPTRTGNFLVFRTVLRDSVNTPLELTLEERTCSDGMSDHMYTHSAVAKVGSRVLQGCAELRSAASDSARRQ